jgi:hypothetical protein
VSMAAATHSHSSEVQQLQHHLLKLMDDVQRDDREDPRQRAEVLIALNVFCSEDLLLGLWQLLEEVDMRQEMLLVRLLIDMTPDGVEDVCARLLTLDNPELRSMGYGILALQSTRGAARRLVEAFDREPGLVLKRGGKKKFAPYSFATCMLAGIREFKDPTLDRVAMQCLRRFAEGAEDITLLLELLHHDDPKAAKLGFVALASRVMGYIHRAAYEHVICLQPASLLFDPKATDWLSRAITEAPEIIEVICEQGPPRLDGPTFIRARLLALREVGDEVLTRVCADLLSGQRRLPSVRIEEALYPKAALSEAGRHLKRARTLAYLIALLMEYRPVLSALIEALIIGEEVEVNAVERMLSLSSDAGAFNVATALIAHWHQLDPDDADQAPFWRWVDGIWHDDRHLRPQQALLASLSSPDETAGYAAEILSAVDDPFGQLLRHTVSGELVSRADILPLLDQPWLPALRARLRHPSSHLHPQTLIAFARLGAQDLRASFKARRAACIDESPERGALDYALRLLDAHRLAAASLPDPSDLDGALGLRMLDQRFERGASALARVSHLPSDHPLPTALRNQPTAGLLQMFFWATDIHDLPLARLINKPWALSFEAVIDLDASQILASRWLDGALTQLPAPPCALPPPPALTASFLGLPWRTPRDGLDAALTAADGELLVLIPREGLRARARAFAVIQEVEVRLEFDRDGLLFRALQAAPKPSLPDAIAATTERFGPPTFATPRLASWRFTTLDLTLTQDPSFGLTEQVTLR